MQHKVDTIHSYCTCAQACKYMKDDDIKPIVQSSHACTEVCMIVADARVDVRNAYTESELCAFWHVSNCKPRTPV